MCSTYTHALQNLLTLSVHRSLAIFLCSVHIVHFIASTQVAADDSRDRHGSRHCAVAVQLWRDVQTLMAGPAHCACQFRPELIRCCRL